MSIEKDRLKESSADKPWKKWGPYLTERQWGTVREDYSEDGAAWNFTTHEMARSKAYRWGEEGIGGISDDRQLLCMSFAFWNKKDPILKERIFGLTGAEGNHGEDPKDYYYYLDSTPTHSYMKMLYKYPQEEFPYAWLVEENQKRGRLQPEFELVDTNIFRENKYFDIFLEYAKPSPEDVLIKITIDNHGDVPAVLDVIPTLWFRNTWAHKPDEPEPRLYAEGNTIKAEHYQLGNYNFYADIHPELLFCNNETNNNRLYGTESDRKYFKDGINDYVVNGNIDAVNPAREGTKAGARYNITVDSNNNYVIRLRLSANQIDAPFEGFDALFNQCK